jgi:hypothetical protein
MPSKNPSTMDLPKTAPNPLLAISNPFKIK